MKKPRKKRKKRMKNKIWEKSKMVTTKANKIEVLATNSSKLRFSAGSMAKTGTCGS
jgi:hypothetical protein